MIAVYSLVGFIAGFACGAGLLLLARLREVQRDVDAFLGADQGEKP